MLFVVTNGTLVDIDALLDATAKSPSANGSEFGSRRNGGDRSRDRDVVLQIGGFFFDTNGVEDDDDEIVHGKLLFPVKLSCRLYKFAGP